MNENMEYYRFTINETINRCMDEKALRFVYHILKGIKPELRPRTRAERETMAERYELSVEDVTEGGSLI